MKVFTASALIAAFLVAGCSSDPLKYRLEDKLIGSLPADKMKTAEAIKNDFLAAKKALDVAKLKLKLYEMEMEAAERFAEAAQYAVKATREKLSLQNKGVPVKVDAGTLERKIEEAKLAKKNLKYRKLLYELHAKRLKHQFLVYHQLRADYYEKAVNVLHQSGDKKDIDKFKKSDFVRQAAERKTMVAEALEQVEQGLRTIKTLEPQVKPNWAPSLSCKATNCPECKCPEKDCPECKCPAAKSPDLKKPEGTPENK